MLVLATSRTISHVEFISMRDKIWSTINKSGLDHEIAAPWVMAIILSWMPGRTDGRTRQRSGYLSHYLTTVRVARPTATCLTLRMAAWLAKPINAAWATKPNLYRCLLASWARSTHHKIAALATRSTYKIWVSSESLLVCAARFQERKTASFGLETNRSLIRCYSLKASIPTWWWCDWSVEATVQFSLRNQDWFLERRVWS
jgi:hypothetical protein